jgi:hypothetical protein
MRTIHYILLSCLFIAATGFGQSNSTEISITSSPTGAEVFVDTAYAGITPLSIELSAGKHLLKAAYPSFRDWNAVSVADTLFSSPGAILKKHYSFGGATLIDSDPSSAHLSNRQVRLGTTPYYYHSASANDTLRVDKNGYLPFLLITDAGMNPWQRIQLEPISGIQPDMPRSVFFNGEISNGRNPFLAIAAGTAMVASASTAALLKNQANEAYDRYLVTREPHLKDRTDRLDVYSTISIVLTEISFAVLAYVLLD